ncbi:MAG: rod shape-determining protein RodA [Candidatus Omnitrophica bacterium]|nr:rod shape-determining protein RodA [Candidatus Omnitrophota bacterium]MCG2704124.1 rod shape-determining protein RodA [Candidatus Omnitrophota bacterium]
MLKNIDYVLGLILIVLLIFGLVALFSASYQKQLDTGKSFVLTQMVWIFIGLIIVFFVTLPGYHSFLSASYILYGLDIFLLLLVLVMGKTALGAQRWISIAGIGVQPSEISKIVTILALARMIGDNPQRLKTVRGLIGPALMVLIPMLLIFKQPDLGTALVFAPIFLSMLWVGGIRLKYLIIALAAGITCLPLGWYLLKDYQRDRLLVFINPDLDPLGAGYTINQSKIAIGSGMCMGKGWLTGTQNQLNFLPERHTDFIFSVVGEEWGFIGTAIVLFVFLLLVMRGLKIAETTNDISGKLIAVGVTTMLALHVIINIGMTLGLMPVVGMPLPFISYGGSALISNLIAVGFLFNVRMHKTMF